MKWVGRLFLLLALVALGLWLWSLLFPSPEKLIRKRLTKLARAVTFTSNEGPFALANHISNLESCFSVDAQVNLDAPDHSAYVLNGRDEIRQAAKAMLVQDGALKVEFLDEEVTLAADKLSATVDLTVKATKPRDQDFYVQEMKFVLKKINGEWLIVRIQTVKTLSRVQTNGVRCDSVLERGCPLPLSMDRPSFEKRQRTGGVQNVAVFRTVRETRYEIPT
jgi:hypothetical protein